MGKKNKKGHSRSELVLLLGVKLGIVLILNTGFYNFVQIHCHSAF